MTAIAIDPGQSGAVALVDGGRLLGWAAWRKMRRRSDPYDVACSSSRRVLSVAYLPRAVGAALCHLPPDVDLRGAACAVEGIEPHGRRRGHDGGGDDIPF